ncbi:MAG: hypothetical protein JST00_32645 [Deltaproteobacteria bacterium]|nr:hypothetical protein [Deltaproteobacteria bacterium]
MEDHDRGAEHGAFEIAVDAIDVAGSEARELESFRRAVTEPDEGPLFERAGPTLSARTWKSVLRGFFWLRLAGALGLFGAIAAEALGSTLSNGAFLALLGGSFLTMVVAERIFGGEDAKLDDAVRDRVRITIDGRGLSLVGSTVPRRVVPLSSIARFVGEGELAVELRDGSRLALGLRLENEAGTADLATRLDGALVEARAAGGYRGRAQRASQR